MKKMMHQPGQTTNSFVSDVQVDRRPSLDEIHFALIFCFTVSRFHSYQKRRQPQCCYK